MRFIKRAAVISILAAAPASAAFAQANNPEKSQNLRDCLVGFLTCNHSLLTPDQATQIAAIERDRNRWNCLTGYGICDRSQLSPTEARDVADSEHRRNLLACKTTIGICDQSLLTPSEAAAVAKIDKQRNLLNCETGAGLCDHTSLTPSEAEEVKNLERERQILTHARARTTGRCGRARTKSSGLQNRTKLLRQLSLGSVGGKGRPRNKEAA
jgi:hypothetical protein